MWARLFEVTKFVFPRLINILNFSLKAAKFSQNLRQKEFTGINAVKDIKLNTKTANPGFAYSCTF